MFTFSEHNKERPEGSGSNSRTNKVTTGSLKQNIMNCPEILNGLSREMRTQMNAIVAFAYILNKRDFNEAEGEELSNQVYYSCEQIISMIDNFLDSAIIDTGNSVPEPKICDPDKIISDLFLEFMEVMKRDQYKDILFMTEPQLINNTDCQIDANRITRVIRNLFQIALSNTRSGYIKAGYYFRNEKLNFYILDSGDGYFKCKEFLETNDLTQSLTRFSDTYTAVNLILMRKIIQIIGGSVWIECIGSAGSGIYFSVPVTVRGIEKSDVKHFKVINTI